MHPRKARTCSVFFPRGEGGLGCVARGGPHRERSAVLAGRARPAAQNPIALCPTNIMHALYTKRRTGKGPWPGLEPGIQLGIPCPPTPAQGPGSLGPRPGGQIRLTDREQTPLHHRPRCSSSQAGSAPCEPSPLPGRVSWPWWPGRHPSGDLGAQHAPSLHSKHFNVSEWFHGTRSFSRPL